VQLNFCTATETITDLLNAKRVQKRLRGNVDPAWWIHTIL